MQTLDSLAQLAAVVPAAVELTFVPDRELNPDAEPLTEPAVLLRVWGAGDDLRAEFRTTWPAGSFDWEAYVFDGRLSYGTSAEELQVGDRVVPLVSL